MTKFSSALNNPQTRKQLVKFFESEIKEDASKIDLLFSNGKTEVFKTVSEIVDSNPELIIIIEQQHDELTSIFNSLPFKGKINVFKTFTRDGLEEGDSVFQIEPIFKERRLPKAESNTPVSRTIKTKSTGISKSIEAIKSYQELVNNSEIKIGKIAFHFFSKLAEEGKLNKLYDAYPNRKINSFHILKRIRKDDINNAKRENGISRYYSKAFVDNETYYLLCSQWYDKHISILKDIIKELSLY